MIRSATSHDAAQIAEIYNYYIRQTTFTFEEVPVSEAEMRNRIESVQATYPWIVVESDDIIQGYAYASQWKSRSAYRFSVESTVYLRHSVTGRGFGQQLYTELIGQLTQMGIHVIIGGITLPNNPSVKLHEKMGFRKVAEFKEVGFKFGKWLNVGYWELING